MSGDNPVADILRLNDLERREVQAYIDRTGSKKSGAAHGRVGQRFRYETSKPTIVEIPNPSGGVQSYSVIPKDLSATGCAFIHGSFVYPGSRVTITLWTLDGERLTVTGTAMRCVHVKGRAHEVAIRFDDAITTEDYVNSGKSGEAAEEASAIVGEAGITDTDSLRKTLAELAALCGARDCPAAIRKKVQQLARVSAQLEVVGWVESAPTPAAPAATSDGHGAAPAAHAKPDAHHKAA